MSNRPNIFIKKKILIYGLGKSGLSTYNFLKNKSHVSLYDDNGSKLNKIKKKILNYSKVINSKFDQIILSPGIDINRCKLSKFLKKNENKIYTDLDIFYKFYKNDCITITGTNGKSTTCKLLYDILKNQKFNVELVGNIGKPILSVKKVNRKSIFIIEASSYQLEYSKIFKSKYAAIINITPDHLDRHKTIQRYVNAKFKLLENQDKNSFSFVKKNDILIKNKIKLQKFKNKLIKVDTKKKLKIFKRINNNLFLTETNKENLIFVLTILQKFKLKKELILKSIKNFKGLDYRQQIVFKDSNITIINDSKSTSFSSSISILKMYPNIFWLLGGIPKKGDKFNLNKKECKNLKAFVYGKNKSFFYKQLKKKMKIKSFKNLKNTFKYVLDKFVDKEKIPMTLLFSPCAASFDSFKNFEDRGLYFNKLIKKYFYAKNRFNK